MSELGIHSVIELNGIKYELVGSFGEGKEAMAIGQREPEKPDAQKPVPDRIPISELSGDTFKTESDDAVARFAMMLREKKFYRTALGAELDIPEPPMLLMETRKKLAEVFGENHHFEAHYLPPGKLFEGGIEIGGKPYTYPEKVGMIDDRFFRLLRNDMIPESTLYLPGGWVLIDTAQPVGNGVHYADDPFQPMLQQLEEAEGREFDFPGNRFTWSHAGLVRTVLPAIAEQLGITGEAGQNAEVCLPRFAEFHILMHLYRNILYDAHIYEWAADKIKEDSRMMVECRVQEDDGIAVTDFSVQKDRDFLFTGFRPIIRFTGDNAAEK